jgi:hypothetical protein
MKVRIFELFVFNVFKRKTRKQKETKIIKTPPVPRQKREGRDQGSVCRAEVPWAGRRIFRGRTYTYIYIYIYMHTKLYICMCACTNIWAKQIQAEYVYIYIYIYPSLAFFHPAFCIAPLPQAVHFRSAERLHFCWSPAASPRLRCPIPGPGWNSVSSASSGRPLGRPDFACVRRVGGSCRRPGYDCVRRVGGSCRRPESGLYGGGPLSCIHTSIMDI